MKISTDPISANSVRRHGQPDYRVHPAWLSLRVGQADEMDRWDVSGVS